MNWMNRSYRAGWMAADSSASTSSAVPGIGAANVIGASVQALTGIASTIAGISDMNKRREIERSLAVLNNQQKKQLDQQLLAAKTQTERLSILSNAVVNFAISNQQAANRTKMILFITAGVLATGLLTLVIIKMRK